MPLASTWSTPWGGCHAVRSSSLNPGLKGLGPRMETQGAKLPAVAPEKAREALVVFQTQDLDGDDGPLQYDDEYITQDHGYPMARGVHHAGQGEHRHRQGHMVEAEGGHAQEGKGVGD